MGANQTKNLRKTAQDRLPRIAAPGGRSPREGIRQQDIHLRTRRAVARPKFSREEWDKGFWGFGVMLSMPVPSLLYASQLYLTNARRRGPEEAPC